MPEFDVNVGSTAGKEPCILSRERRVRCGKATELRGKPLHRRGGAAISRREPLHLCGGGAL